MGEHGTRAATRRAAARFSQELASSRLALTAALVIGGFEAKANFNPDQPREPRGRPTGGRWVSYAGERLAGIARDVRSAIGRATGEVEAFLILNEERITRFFGGLQAAGGAAEAGAGVAVARAGGATPAAPIALLLGTWMTANGIDNFDTGMRSLITGEPHETNLNRILRGWGLSERDAALTEMLLGGGTGLASVRVSRAALARQVDAALARRALEAFSENALDVRVGGGSIWAVRSIERLGESWEAFDAQRTGYRLTSRFFPGVDQISPDGRVVVSNKTLNTAGSSYQANNTAMFNRLKIYVDQLVAFPPPHLRGLQPVERRLHLLLPAGRPVPGHALQLSALEAYARARGVVLQVEYSH